MTLNKKFILPLAALLVVAIVLTGVTAAVLSQQILPSDGTIQAPSNVEPDPTQGPISSTINIDIYKDAAGTVKCTGIQWGTLNPGQTISQTVYIKNSGNTAEILNMTATQWSPEVASSVLTLSWNKEGASLAAGQIVPATLTLQVAQDTGSLTSFNLNIVISGSA